MGSQAHGGHPAAASRPGTLTYKFITTKITGTEFPPREHRARVDGRATARHLHGIIERAVRCDTVKVSAESAGAVAR